MSTQAYQLHLSKDQNITIDLRTDEPIYRIVERLVEEHQLPTTDSHNQVIRYALYAGQLRRMSNEMSLRQAGYDQGGDLFLTNVFDPWWETLPAVTRRLPETEVPVVPLVRRLPWKVIAGIAGGLLVIGGILLMVSNRSAEARAVPTITVAAVAVASSVPATATLAPAPTSAPPPTELVETISVPTATLQPSTPIPVILATNTPQVPLITILGVQRDYLDRDDRLFFIGKNSFGAYLWADQELTNKVPAGSGSIVISNGDQVYLLGESNGIYQIKIKSNAIDANDQQVLDAIGYIPAWLVTNTAIPTPKPLPPTPTPDPRRLRVRLLNYDDQPGCISIRVAGVNTSGWTFTVDNISLSGRFDNSGNARLCGLNADQQVTISIRRRGQAVPGGGGVPSKGRAIMYAEWR
jgi:hypothetical protein